MFKKFRMPAVLAMLIIALLGSIGTMAINQFTASHSSYHPMTIPLLSVSNVAMTTDPSGISNPSSNLAPINNFDIAGVGFPCTFVNYTDNSVLCTTATLADINAAHLLEGVPPISLPGNWYSMSTAVQIFTIMNMERTSFGLAPMVGMAAPLDAAAQAGANSGTDPQISGFGFGSIYAEGYVNVLAADFDWMYSDGYGSINLACTTPSSPSCWGHRENILADPSKLGCGSCYLYGGAGFAMLGTTPSYAAILVVSPNPLSLDYAWAGVAASGPLVTGMAATPQGNGYWLVDSVGGISTYGGAQFYGSMLGQSLNQPIAHMVATPDGKGYWLVASDGGVFAIGDAPFYGSTGNLHLNAPVVDIAPTPDGKGYWLVASDGGIFSFGDAPFYGSMGGQHLNKPVVGMGVDAATGGYWLVASDGGIFSFGGAYFFGSTGSLHLNQPILSMAVAPHGSGYWMVASDGGIFAFGGAHYYGSMGGQPLGAPIVEMAVDAATGGYWLAGTNAAVYSFGAPFYGSAGTSQ